MTNPKAPAADAVKHDQPSAGGSYVRNPDGTLTLVESTSHDEPAADTPPADAPPAPPADED